MSQTILITGFPGFLAGQLIRQLRQQGAAIHALVLPAMRQAAEQQAAEISRQDGLPDLALVEGDITAPDLGLTAEAAETLAASVTQVFHLAAIYDLAVAEALAEKVNVAGTRHVLDFCERVAQLERLVYFSTCYVAGRRGGTILESELETGQRFRNFYESTKYAAEVEVRSRMERIPTVIIRPSVVVGDSRSGVTIKYDGPYFVMAMFARWERRGIGFLRCLLPDFGWVPTTLNVAPVDFIIEATVALADEPEATGRTFQLADPAPLLTREVVKQVYQLFGVPGPLVRLPAWFGRAFIAIPGVTWAMGFPRQMFDYYDVPQTYDTAGVQELLGARGIACPQVRDYLPVLVEYVRKHPFEPGQAIG